MMANTGVLHATARLRVPEKMTWMLDSSLQHNTVRMSTTTTNQKAHRVHER